MTMTISGSSGVTFPDSTTQSTRAIPANAPIFSAGQNTTQSIPATTPTKIVTYTEEFDTANCFDPTAGRFTPNVAGYYRISGCVSGGMSGAVYSMIYKNGAEYKRGMQLANPTSCMVDCIVFMNGTTDYVELYTFCTVTGSTNGATFLTHFEGNLVRLQ